MTTAGETTVEDRQWAFDFIRKNFMDSYFSVLHDNIPRDAPNWHRLFHEAWSSDNSPRETYDKALWIRREHALTMELKAAYARFIGRNIEDDEEELQSLIVEYGLKEKLIEQIRNKSKGLTFDR